MNMIDQLASALILACMFFSGEAEMQASIQKQPGIQFTPLTFTSVSGVKVEAEMGWLIVPEKRSKRKSSVIRIPVVRFKSTSANPGFPIIYLAGGPGASGIQSARQAIFPLLMELRKRGDVIVFDQRGTGKAEPSLVTSGRFDLPTDAALDSKSSLNQLSVRSRQFASEIRDRGIDLSSYNTNENADDVNDLRLALGFEKVIIWGHSYGSHLGLAVIKRHGKHIYRAVLGGINGPDQRWRYPDDMQALIERVDNRLNDFPKLRREVPSLKRLVEEVLGRLEKQPVTVQVQSKPVLVGKKEIQVLTALMAGDLEFIISMPLFFNQMREGNYTRAAQLTLQMLKNRPPDTSMRYAMHIASGVSSGRATKIDSQIKSALFGNAINFPFDNAEFLAAWRIEDLGADYRKPVKSDIPTLFLSGDLDGRTSIDDAKEVIKGFSNSRHVIIEGASHDFYHLSPKVLDAITVYLDGKEVVTRISIPVQFRGLNEFRLIEELRQLVNTKGVEVAVRRLRGLSAVDSDMHVSSYVAGTLGLGLWQDDKKPGQALEIFKAGLESFPKDAFLYERLADLYVETGVKDLAIAHYRKCVELNSLNLGATKKLKDLEDPNK